MGMEGLWEKKEADFGGMLVDRNAFFQILCKGFSFISVCCAVCLLVFPEAGSLDFYPSYSQAL